MLNPISGVNTFLAVGSNDGTLGVAGCLRTLICLGTSEEALKDIHIIFTQAFDLDQINPESWPQNRVIGIIDLGVNTDLALGSRLTVDFIKKIKALGHSILFIADEHGKKDWNKALQKCNLPLKRLTICPQDRKDYGSSCAILLKALDGFIDDHTKELFTAGDEADQMRFDSHFGNIVNSIIKTSPWDLSFRHHLVWYLARHREPDATIREWMAPYALLQENLPLLLASRRDLPLEETNKPYKLPCFYAEPKRRYDATVFFREAYKTDPIVLLCYGRRISIGTNKKKLDLLTLLKNVNIQASGMKSKACFPTEDLNQAVEVLLSSKKVQKAIERHQKTKGARECLQQA